MVYLFNTHIKCYDKHDPEHTTIQAPPPFGWCILLPQLWYCCNLLIDYVLCIDLQSGDKRTHSSDHPSLEKAQQLNIPCPKQTAPTRPANKWEENVDNDNFFGIYKRKQDRSMFLLIFLLFVNICFSTFCFHSCCVNNSRFFFHINRLQDNVLVGKQTVTLVTSFLRSKNKVLLSIQLTVMLRSRPLH